MKMNQIAEIVNTITAEVEGITPLVTEDLSNVVEVGEQIINVMGVDNFVRALSDHIGKMIFVNRVYGGRAPSVLMDGWEYGSILQKVSIAKLPTAQENESWELVDGASYDENIFTAVTVSEKFWNKKTTFEIPVSFAERQVKSAFNTPTQLNSFISMIYTVVNNTLTVKRDALIMRTINNFMAETLAAEYNGVAFNSKSGVRAVNLLYLFNQKSGTTAITAEQAVTNPEFIRFAVYVMTNYIDQLKVMSQKFNIGGADRFTPESDLHVVMLSEFYNAAGVYLQSDTFHDRYTALPNADTVPFWQGSGESNEFADHSAIDVLTASNQTAVKTSGILGVFFDRNALGVSNYERRVTSKYNNRAEFWNEWHKFEAGYFNDLEENGIVFFVA